jgi:tripartite-type tricarboxylate transporter receptor subunit TctC
MFGNVSNLRLLASLALIGSAALGAPATHAQGNFPVKPLRFVIGVVPGGGADTLGRLIATRMSERLGQPVVVENITGASGQLAIQTVIKAPPDAHTVSINTSTSYNAVLLSGRIPGDHRKLLAPVAQLTSQPLVMIGNVSLPIHTMQDLIAYGRKNPEGINYGSPGIGGSSHLIGEMINQKTGLKMVHVPYKGIGPAILDVISGRIQLVFTSPTSAGPHVRTGKVRLIAASGGKRSAGLPDLPTMAEQGVDIDWVSWFGIFTTFGSPRASILRLNAVINESAATPEMQKMFAADGADPVSGSPEQFGQAVNHVYDTGAKLIKDMGLKLE